MTPRTWARNFALRAYERLPPNLQQRAFKAARIVHERTRRADASALLTVVMPVYNVETYLAEAVDSVLEQSYRHLELILVDDGSTDSSAAMCDSYADRDPRVRVIHKRNGGLGAARNTGIEAARGGYICFIDSDDYVLPGAYANMMGALRRSGSDMITGNVRRRAGRQLFQAFNQSLSHRLDRTAVTLTTVPELVYDTVAWNKIFRLTFWNEHVRTFPVGKLYEDMLPIFTAMLNARGIDILARPVYVWRRRDEGDSITQRLLEPRNIGDRVEMLDAILLLIHEHALADQLLPILYRKLAAGDLWIYVRSAAGAEGETAERLRDAVRQYWWPAPEPVKAMLAPERRLQYWLVGHGRISEIARFQQWYELIRARPPMRRHNGRMLLDVSACPVDLTDVTDDELDMAAAAEPVAMLTGLHWHGLRLTVEGYAYTRFVSTGSQQITLRAALTGTPRTVEWSAERTGSVAAALDAIDAQVDHRYDGFRVEFDATELADGATSGSSRWEFAVHIRDAAVDGAVDVVRETELTKFQHSTGIKVAGGRTLPRGGTAYLTTEPGEPLTLIFDDTGIAATSFGVTGDEVRVEFAPASGVSRVRMNTTGSDVVVPGTRHGRHGYTVRVPAPARAAIQTWRLRAQVGDAQLKVFPPPGFVADTASNPQGIRADTNQRGRAVAHAHAPAALVTLLDVDAGGAIELRGSTFGLDRFTVGLAPAGGTPTQWYPARTEDGTFTARLPVEAADLNGVVRPLPAGAYEIHGATAPGSALVVMADSVAADLPISRTGENTKVRVERAPQGRIRLRVGGPVSDDLLGRYAQAQLLAQATRPDRRLEDAVFFCVDLGSNAGDSALAIHHELRRRGTALTSYWGVEDLSVTVPEGGVPVVKRSADWYAKLNGSRYVVNNYGGILGLEKHPDQRYLQTWHGTPFKYVGVSEVRHKNAPAAQLEVIAHEAAQWDAVVSPSPYLSALVPGEFCFDGPILETGYPRNDRLTNATDGERADLRRMFGLPDGAKVLLYAPTYRERDRHGWRAAMFDGLDLGRLMSLLGPEWYVLLRGHSFVARDDHADRSAQHLIDVTRHHDINDLYLAADVLVTDYSSAMFDFAVTGKPMAFFTPDLKSYVTTRGAYFDLAAVAPGPMYTDVNALAIGLNGLGALAREHAERYASFVERFAPWDDGGAAARVVDAFFA